MHFNVIPGPITAVPSEEAFDWTLLKGLLQSAVWHVMQPGLMQQMSRYIQGLLEDALQTTPVFPERTERSVQPSIDRCLQRWEIPLFPPPTESRLAFVRGQVLYRRLFQNLRDF